MIDPVTSVFPASALAMASLTAIQREAMIDAHRTPEQRKMIRDDLLLPPAERKIGFWPWGGGTYEKGARIARYAFVGVGAHVSATGIVSKSAQVYDHAVIHGSVMRSGEVFGNAVVFQHSRVTDSAQVGGDAIIGGGSPYDAKSHKALKSKAKDKSDERAKNPDKDKDLEVRNGSPHHPLDDHSRVWVGGSVKVGGSMILRGRLQFNGFFHVVGDFMVANIGPDIWGVYLGSVVITDRRPFQYYASIERAQK